MSKDRVDRYDGDLIFSTSNPIIIKGIQGGNPISYERPKTNKTNINKDVLFESDVLAMGNKIGYITNISSTFHSMKSDFEKGSLERNELEKRLKLLRMYQGQEIDSGKGAIKKPIPQHWTKWQRIDNDLSEEDKDAIRFENSIIADKRPKFMIYLYSNYIYDYKRRVFEREYWSRQFGCGWEEIKTKKNISKEETDGVDWYRRRFPYIENNSVMNIVEKTCSNKIRENQIKLKAEDFDYSRFIKDKTRNVDWVEKFYKTYKYLKSSRSYSENASENVKQAAKIIRDEIFKEVSADIDYILDCVLLYFYETKKTKETEFIWKCFGKDLIYRLVEMYDEYVLPVKSNSGDFCYLWEKYELRKIPLVKNEENC